MILLPLHALLILGFGIRILLRDRLAPDVRMAWLVVLIVLPYVGCVLYFLFGEANIGRHSRHRYRRAEDLIAHHIQDAHDRQALLGTPADVQQWIAPEWQPAFSYAASVQGFNPVPGNLAELMSDGTAARKRMLADIDAACEQVNLLYYIWLTDETGTEIAQALIRAASRGVVCRAMVDGLGSRALINSSLWQQMKAAGVHLAIAMPIRHPLHVMLTSRIDLRNHRKITLIDNRITYSGSQNCADEAFRVKAKFAPWVDIMLRLEGPVVAQTQLLFTSDWIQMTGQDIAVFTDPVEPLPAGFPALVFGDGPTERGHATPQLLATLIAAAREELTISTPYFVPDATVLEALCAAAWRGVKVTLIFPRRNDSWIVAGASRSTYSRLLDAGCAIHEYRGGLLHAKTLTLDGEVTLIGSTNLDRRSFDLNFENNVLLQDRATTAAIARRQQAYLLGADVILDAEVLSWSWPRRIWNNLLATIGPVL